MQTLFKVSYTTILLFTSYFCQSQDQVTGVRYYMEYNYDNCQYDCSIIIDEGNATLAPYRTQFNSNYTIVVPTGTTINIEETYLPIQNNQNYTGTVPADWVIGASAINANGLGIDYHPIVPSISPSAQFNDITEGDTLKLFSFSVDGNTDCGAGVRFYENGVDQNANGADYSSGYTIGGPWEDFLGTAPIAYPSVTEIQEPTIDNDGVVSIDLTLDMPSCMSSYSILWTGPNGYTTTEEDVMINPATPADYGMYKVVIEDGLGCKDSLEVIVEDASNSGVDDLTVSEVIWTPTFEHMGVHLNLTGDDNMNSTMTIEYRLTGTDLYLPGAITMRATPESIVNGSPLNMNFHAGSAMHLMPNSSYDFRITVTDPDGGSQIIEDTKSTKKYPTYVKTGTTKYVIPGTSGGDGSVSNPYQGLQNAVDNLSPGDILEVADGTYDPFVITTSGIVDHPIVLRSTNLHGAIIDGMNTSAGIMTIGSASEIIQHVIIDGFEITNGAWGIDAQNTQFLTVRNNKINDVDYGFYNRRENGWEHDQYIKNNEIVGRTPWPQLNGEIPGERGIDIRGNRNVISYNTISDFADGVSTDGPQYKKSYAIDIHHNLITRIVDDIIEVDGTVSNARVYKNKGFNGRSGVSLAPIYGGPAYVFRNEFYNLENSAFKMNNQSAGLVVLNNSIAKANRGMTSSVGWQNTIFKNNALLSGHYVMEEFGLVATSNDDWDYNAYYSLRSGTAAGPWFKFDNIKYNNIDLLIQSGVTEANTIETSYADFNNVVIPSSYGVEALFSEVDFGLASGSLLIGGSTDFDNIFLNDVIGDLDIGALEYEQPTPTYGHEFDIVCERVDLTARLWNGEVHNGWFHPSNWTPCGVPEKISDVTIPGLLDSYPILNTDASINNLSIHGSGRLDIIDEAILTLKGN